MAKARGNWSTGHRAVGLVTVLDRRSHRVLRRDLRGIRELEVVALRDGTTQITLVMVVAVQVQQVGLCVLRRD